jgi:hypothetical protein
MNHISTGDGYAYADGTSDARDAEREADWIGRKLEEGTLTAADAIAHGARGLIFAVLATRKTVVSTLQDNGDAITALDSTLSVLADAAAGTSISASVLADAVTGTGNQAQDPPAAILTWIPAWERGTPDREEARRALPGRGYWDMQPDPAGGGTRLAGAFVPPEFGRGAAAAGLGSWVSAQLGYPVTLARRWRLAAGRLPWLRIWPQPVWYAYPAAPRPLDDIIGALSA